MTEIFWKDTSGIVRAVERHGGPNVTQLSYVDTNNRTKKFEIPTIQNIDFSQSRNISSRSTVRGSFRQQYGQEKPPSVSFQIIMNEDLFNGLKQLQTRNEILISGLSAEDKKNALAGAKYDINKIVSGDGSSFTIKQLIAALEDAKSDGSKVTLTTSSPLDDLLNDMVITDISYSHSAASRQIVSCTIKCTIVKFVVAEFERVVQSDILGISINTGVTDDSILDSNIIDKVHVDGDPRFGTLIPIIGYRYKGIEQSVGEIVREAVPDSEDLNWYMTSEIFTVDSTSVTELQFKFLSDLGVKSKGEDGQRLRYLVDLAKVKVGFHESSEVKWDVVFRRTSNYEDRLGLTLKYYSMALSYPRITSFPKYDLFDTYNYREISAFLANQSPYVIDPKDTDISPTGSSINVDTDNNIYGVKLQDKYTFGLTVYENSAWRPKSGGALTDNFKVEVIPFTSTINFDIDTDLINEDDVMHSWYGDDYTDNDKITDLYLAFCTKGDKAVVLLFGTNTLNASKVAEVV